VAEQAPVWRAIFPLGERKAVEVTIAGGPVTPAALQMLHEYLDLWRRRMERPAPAPPAEGDAP
jgi:hypothetical protein